MQAAPAKISDGHGFADTVAYVMSEWGCSRSTARRDVHWAHGELQLGLDAHDVQHLVTHLCTSLQRISLKAEGHQQYGASVGALRLLYDILLSRRLDNEAKQLLVITSLASLGTALLFGLASHGPTVIDAVPRVG